MAQIVSKAGKVNSTSCHACAESLWWGKVLAPSCIPNKTPASYQNCQWKQQNLQAKAEKFLLTPARRESCFGHQSFSSDREGNLAFFFLFYQLTEQSPDTVPSLENGCAEIHLMYLAFFIHRVSKKQHTQLKYEFAAILIHQAIPGQQHSSYLDIYLFSFSHLRAKTTDWILIFNGFEKSILETQHFCKSRDLEITFKLTGI